MHPHKQHATTLHQYFPKQAQHVKEGERAKARRLKTLEVSLASAQGLLLLVGYLAASIHALFVGAFVCAMVCALHREILKSQSHLHERTPR